MSDEDRDIDVESDEIGDGGDGLDEVGTSGGKSVDKRAHHNALERKRRDHIKDSFTNLRDCIPSLSGEKVSRAHVLNKATEYIRQMQRNSTVRSVEIEELRKKNEILEEQVNGLEEAQERGSPCSPEDLIASIAEKVQQRQLLRQQQQQQQQAANSTKLNKIQLEPPSTEASGNSKEKTNEGTESPNSFNVLANNIRTTQNILSALAKNLSPNTNNQMRAIAARVLASPVRPQGATPTPVPRGVVTATTVPLLADQLSKAVATPTSVSQDHISIAALAGAAGGLTTPTQPISIETSVPSEQVVPSEVSLSTATTVAAGGEVGQQQSEDEPPQSKRFKTS